MQHRIARAFIQYVPVDMAIEKTFLSQARPLIEFTLIRGLLPIDLSESPSQSSIVIRQSLILTISHTSISQVLDVRLDIPNMPAVVIAAIRTAEIQIEWMTLHRIDVEQPAAPRTLILSQPQGRVVHFMPPD